MLTVPSAATARFYSAALTPIGHNIKITENN